MSHIIQLASAAVEAPRSPLLEPRDPAIRTDAVYVVYTSIDDTLAAVRVAGEFAKPLGVPVKLIHFQTVPYAWPVDAPCEISPVETDGFLERIRAEDLDVRVNVYLCRDEHQAMLSALRPHSLIVVAGRRSWWPTKSERWRRMLEGAEQFVVFVDISEHKERSRA
jgi:hypothetical protein